MEVSEVRVYVAGRTTDTERVNVLQEQLRKRGHTITYDWTRNVAEVVADPALYNPGYALGCAEQDWDGVNTADVMIALCARGWLGTAIEIGIALQAGVPIVMVGNPERDCVFFYLPAVYGCKEVEDAIDTAEHVYTRSREAAIAE